MCEFASDDQIGEQYWFDNNIILKVLLANDNFDFDEIEPSSLFNLCIILFDRFAAVQIALSSVYKARLMSMISEMSVIKSTYKIGEMQVRCASLADSDTL